jgi:pilus assembly protein CpaF
MERKEIYQKTLAYFLSPIQSFLEDPTVSEVMVNGPGEIYIERAGRLERTPARFPSVQSLQAAVRNILQFVGKRLTDDTQSYDARLPDGSRVHILLPPSAREGVCVTIRKFSRTVLTLAGLVERGALTEEAREFLELAVLLEKNIVISGGTGSGKTTLLNCLSGVIPAGQRVIVIEDSSELQLQQPHVLYLEVRPPDRYGRGAMSIRELFRASLRMRPDRIVIGEVRGGEAMDLIQAMTSGHSGSLTTAHANTPSDALRRLETMAMMANLDVPLLALRSQVASAINVIVQVSRLHDGARKVTHIAEVHGLDTAGAYVVTEIFRLAMDMADGTEERRAYLVWTGAPVSFADEPRVKGLLGRVRRTQRLFRPGDEHASTNAA